MTLKDVKTWGYQLQNIKPKKIAASAYDLVVIDYASDDGPFTNAQVDEMKRKPDGSRRLVISYMSIGEAETYRPYWNKAWKKEPPPWLGKENREWRGNYGVKFWEPGWQSVIARRTMRQAASETESGQQCRLSKELNPECEFFDPAAPPSALFPPLFIREVRPTLRGPIITAGLSDTGHPSHQQ